MSDYAGAATIRCDVFIVGSGPVGSTFARVLANSGAHVVMADAGDFHSRRAGENKKNNWLNQRDVVQYGHFVRSQLHSVGDTLDRPAQPDSAPEPGMIDYPNAMVSYAVGGMAVHWTCAIPEFHERLERIPYIDQSDMRALYDRAALLLNRHVDVFSGSVRHRAIKRILRDAGWCVADTPMAAERSGSSPFVNYSGADTILGPLAEPDSGHRLDIMPCHIVQRLIASAKNSHLIEYAEVLRMQDGAAVRVYADTFVAAAGWLHTAQLLATSKIHTHAGSALGRYFSDHTMAACTVVLRQGVIQSPAADAPVTGAASHADTASALPVDDPPPHLYIPVADERPWQGMIFRESYQFSSVLDGSADRCGIDLKWFGMIEPVPDNRVTFCHNRLDRLGMPAPSFRLRLSAVDESLKARMMSDMQAVASHLGPYRSGGEPMFTPLGSAIHATGITRMGPMNDGGNTSVVDPWSKVWGIDNLCLGGTSVIPTPTAANPTFTAVALAIRAADAISSRPPRYG